MGRRRGWSFWTRIAQPPSEGSSVTLVVFPEETGVTGGISRFGDRNERVEIRSCQPIFLLGGGCDNPGSVGRSELCLDSWRGGRRWQLVDDEAWVWRREEAD
jgi:hypothetical protein